MTTIDYADWPAPQGIVAGMTNRLCGQSETVFARNNLSSTVGDSEEAVCANRKQLALSQPDDPDWFWLQQIHGVDVVSLPKTGGLVADACFSQSGLTVCGVTTADCLPVLLCDSDAQFVAAIHAGWRSLAGGVIENTVAAIKEALKARNKQWHGATVLAWMGAAISSRHFEVGSEVKQAFTHKQPELNAKAFIDQGGGKYKADIFKLAEIRLQALGIDQIFGDRQCTYANPDKYYSYRRDGQTGRMLSFIYKA